MISRSGLMVEIGRDLNDGMKSSIRWDRVTALDDNELQILLTLLRNTYSAVVSQASIRGVKPAQQLPPEQIKTKEETNG